MTEDEGKKDFFSAMSLVTSLGLSMVGAIGACGFVGYWLDAKFSTSPALLLVGILLGVVSGGVIAYRAILKAMK